MDRHHLLGLLDKLQEKYSLQDGEYKEFAEAIGGKKKTPEFKVGDLVRVEYDIINARMDFGDEKVIPAVDVEEKCSCIWKIIENENNYHVSRDVSYGWDISYKCLNKSDVHMSVIQRVQDQYTKDKITRCTANRYTGHKPCLRVRSLEII